MLCVFRRLPVAALALCLSVSAQAAPADTSEKKLDVHLRGRASSGESRVIVEFNDDRQSDSIITAAGGRSGRKLGILKARAATIPNGLLTKLANHPAVSRISLDRPAVAFNGRTAVTTGARAVNYLMRYDGRGIGVAVIDSGVTAWHDDLTSNGYGQRVANFVDFVGGLPGAYDDWGHGTHVAGIIAGNGHDSQGIRAGVAPGAHIVALKALRGDGAGYISDIIAALDYAVANRDAYNIRVINLSLGAGVYESYNTDPLCLAAKRAVEAGIVVVAAAGNLGKNRLGETQYGAISAPANAPWVLTVGAGSTNGTVWRTDDTIGSYSSRGPTAIDFAAKPDLVAPGTGTISLSDPVSRLYAEKAAFLVSGTITTPFKPYLTLSGTSMAAPVVSGTVALMLQANPSLTPNLVKAILQYTAEVRPSYDFLTQGAGFLNSLGAVRLAKYFATARPGDVYPIQGPWSRHIFWGNHRVTGGVLTPFGSAWATNVVWGDRYTPTGQNIVWGDNCATTSCTTAVWGTNLVWGTMDDNVVWGLDDDNIMWGLNDDNIVWGLSEENIVWGLDCGGADCGDIVWGSAEDNIVWGLAEAAENIVWGLSGDNIVWGLSDAADNITWGSAGDDDTVYPDEAQELPLFDPAAFDTLFGVEEAVTVAPGGLL